MLIQTCSGVGRSGSSLEISRGFHEEEWEECLNNEERKKFAEYNHEYIIERNVIYADKYSLKHNSKSSTTNIHLQLKGLIKDIFLLFKSQDTIKQLLTRKNKNLKFISLSVIGLLISSLISFFLLLIQIIFFVLFDCHILMFHFFLIIF